MPNNKKKIFSILLMLGVYLLSAGLSYSWFSGSSVANIFTSPLVTDDSGQSTTPDNPNRKALIDVTGAKSESCPLNGVLYTKAEKNVWESRRPLAVMIENHQESRPQSGLSDADVIYEAVAEGGITRFMGIFYCGAAEPVTIAPV